VRVLVVGDAPGAAGVLQRGLAEEGFAVDVAVTGEEGVSLGRDNEYDAILLDIRPETDGLALLGDLRSAARTAPLVVLTPQDSVADRVAGLDLGADDCLSKPFAFPELLARLRALLRRSMPVIPPVLAVGDLAMDTVSRRVCRGPVEIAVTAKEFALLEHFLRHPGQVLSRRELLDHVWDVGFDADSNVVEVCVGHLRQKVDRPFGRRSLQTVRGSGYRLTDDLSEDPTDELEGELEITDDAPNDRTAGQPG